MRSLFLAKLVKNNSTRVSTRQLSSKVDAFLNGSNAIYVEQMYAAWKQDPASVHSSWQSYFSNLDNGLPSQQSFVPLKTVVGSVGGGVEAPVVTGTVPVASAASTSLTSDSLGISYLINAYQTRGHEAANLDPLGINAFNSEIPPELDYKFHGFTDNDLHRPLNFLGTSAGGHTGFLYELANQNKGVVTLAQVLKKLQKTYCSSIGVEYMHMSSREKINWVRDQVEQPKWLKFSDKKKLHIYERLCFADTFERFLANKFNTAKRFGLEGGEACIPGLKCLVDRGSELGVESVTFGMPHRGRLNVLSNVMRKPNQQLFKEFQGTHYDFDEYSGADWYGSNDVKYHLGTSMDRTYPDGRKLHLSLVANPSHLEAVNPVALGKVRAKQFLSGNSDKSKHLGIIIHGDAAFAGQGIVYETFQLSRVPDFDVGGTIHVVINNQVGFTTDPQNSRSTKYCSDIAKSFDVPVFHCNGDDPLSVVSAFEMAIEWRQKFLQDVVIDMICYRRNGHNELDQPMYTQPIMYSKIAKHESTLAIFEKNLLSSNTIKKEELDKIKKHVQTVLETDYATSKDWVSKTSQWLSSKWGGFLSPNQKSRVRQTGYSKEKLIDIGLKIGTIPEGFNPHKQIEKIIATRKDSIAKNQGIDWGTAEALAFGSLLLEGNNVRLTGQDVERGTFSHRHAAIVDQKTGEKYIFLNNINKIVSPVLPTAKGMLTPEQQGAFTVRNSILSEFGVLGFELGYSLENPNMLNLWEAQFGDFANGAQIMIDQFISAGEDKWFRQSGLTMLLPHGYMGQGAEHSSCRLERFLQQVDEDPDVVPPMSEGERMQIQRTNWQVVNVSTPANYFHVLRRQVHRDFRKPLIVASPKNLLRDKRCTSTLDEMAEGTKFQRVIGEVDSNITSSPQKVKKLVFVSGKFYYDLVEEREKKGANDVAIVRVEQLAPFPFDKVAEQIALYDGASEIIWAQEEPKNMGAWSFIEPRIATCSRVLNGKERRARYVGRKPAAATATGLGSKAHATEQQNILNEIF